MSFSGAVKTEKVCKPVLNTLKIPKSIFWGGSHAWQFCKAAAGPNEV